METKLVNVTRFDVGVIDNIAPTLIHILPKAKLPAYVYKMFGESERLFTNAGELETMYVATERIVNMPEQVEGIMYVVEQEIAHRLSDRADVIVLSDDDIHGQQSGGFVILKTLIRN